MSQQYNSSHGRARARRLSGFLALLAVMLLTILAPGAFAQTHVANPYSGARCTLARTTPLKSPPRQQPSLQLAGQMATVAKQPTFIWLDHIAAITAVNGNGTATGRMSLQQHINAAVAQAGGAEIVVQTRYLRSAPTRLRGFGIQRRIEHRRRRCTDRRRTCADRHRHSGV